MTIKELLHSAGIKQRSGDEFVVRGVAANSKQVGEGFVFIAIKGCRGDGNMYIEEAINNGARLIVRDTGSGIRSGYRGVAVLEVKDARKAAALLSSAFYGHPSRRMHMVGITGTNGKTTVTYLIEAIVRKAGHVPGVIGTINYRYKDRVVAASNTTPGPVELQAMLEEMRSCGVSYVAMEVSSHALHQQRTAGIDFSSAIFTNITQDHLDYHKTAARYFTAKSMLFRSLANGSLAIINADDGRAAALKRLTKARIKTYGMRKKADYCAKDISFDLTHTEFTLSYGKKQERIRTCLIGEYNVYNVLAAAAWALTSGFSLETVKAAIEEFGVVPGRLEKIASNRGYAVFVDYAHTEDALRNVLKTLQQLPRKRIIVVFGCGGERDRSKRAKMGRVASEMADLVIITSDNPRSEDPDFIAQEIRQGILKDNYRLILDRAEAIKEALGIAGSGDIVLLAGKGHEDYQVLKDAKIPFDDREVARRCLI